MILSDRDIKARLDKGDLVVEPITDWDLQLQPASLDVRLGKGFAVYQLPHLPCIDPRDKANIDAVTKPVEPLRVSHLSYIRVNLPSPTRRNM